MKKYYLSKTIRIAALQAILGLLIAFGSEYPEVGGIVLAKSAVDVLIRSLTTGGITK